MSILTGLALCLLLGLALTGETQSQCYRSTAAWDSRLPEGLRYPQCEAPEYIQRPQSPLKVESDPTATVREAEFLSFEEWKARNLANDVVGAQDQARHRTELGHDTHTVWPRASPVTYRSEQSETQSSTVIPQVADDSRPVEIERASRKSEDESEDGRRVASKKERFNHASFDCAASIVQSNRESKGSSNILKENKDYYMLNTCGAANKFVTIELCNDILVDSIQLANYEYFSGVFREVKVQVAAKYPPGREGWQELGRFRARNVRDIQSFHFENPLIWARYVQIEMLSFYGNEFYCPLSLVRVFGKTMMEDYKQEGSQDVEIGTEVALSLEDQQDPMIGPEHSSILPLAPSDQLADKLVPPPGNPAVTVEVDILTTEMTMNTAPPHQTASVSSPESSSTQKSTCSPEATLASLTHSIDTEVGSSSTSYPAPPSATQTSVEGHPSTVSRLDASKSDPQFHNDTTMSSKQGAKPIGGSGKNISDSKHSLPKHTSPHPSPSTQESIYKQIAKRLSLLEANATLSLKYIESQSSLLAQSFSQLSSSQSLHLAKFLENVNITMLQRIKLLNREYEQLYLDAAKSVETARHRQEQDMASVSRKIGTLSDDLTFFKRLGIFQSLLMVILLGFLVTSRGAGIEIQNQLNGTPSRREFSSTSSPARSPSASWRSHFRGISTANSVYSFPVVQIDRPDRLSTPNLTDGGDFDHEGGLGIGMAGLYSEDAVPHPDSVVRIRSPLVHQPSFRSKDDMYDGDLNSSIRRRLNRDASWTGAKAEPQSQEDQVSIDQEKTAAENYPTPRPDMEDDDDDELS